ncbi:hypothetical protein EK904_001821 [Melospiza melodia maxima]|nr:hypothetical protein EK904_001821 [Melospiza melodia maxima]
MGTCEENTQFHVDKERKQAALALKYMRFIQCNEKWWRQRMPAGTTQQRKSLLAFVPFSIVPFQTISQHNVLPSR